MTFCGMPSNNERTAARSPALAAVTSGTLVVSAASAAPARIEELSSPAKMVAHLFIGILPLETVLIDRSVSPVPNSQLLLIQILDRPPAPHRSGACSLKAIRLQPDGSCEGPRCVRGDLLVDHTLARQNQR